MKRNILLALALFVAVSCAPVQAAESKSGWTIFKNSAKIFVGAWITLNGIPCIIVGASGKEGVRAFYQNRNIPVDEDVLGSVPTVLVVGGAGITAGGIALIYSGYKGLTEEEEPVKV